jgi:hypothetical protein
MVHAGRIVGGGDRTTPCSHTGLVAIYVYGHGTTGSLQPHDPFGMIGCPVRTRFLRVIRISISMKYGTGEKASITNALRSYQKSYERVAGIHIQALGYSCTE